MNMTATAINRLIHVDVVIPVLNEQAQLEESVERCHAAISAIPIGRYKIIIADNGSADLTPVIATALTERFPNVRFLRSEKRGRGGALRNAWLRSEADVVAYMDVDLSTDLVHLPEIVRAVTSGECDLAIGSRLLPESRVLRGFKREFLSRSYSNLLRTVLDLQVRDAQCGFKALSIGAARQLLPLVQDDNWFFDTELLMHAQWQGLRSKEIPVKWVEDVDSRVKLFPTILGNLAGILRLWRRRRLIVSATPSAGMQGEGGGA